MTYTAEDKILHRYMSGEKFLTPKGWEKILTPTKSPIPRHKRQMIHPLGGWRRNGFDTLVNDIHHQNGWRAFIKTKVLHFKIENKPIKDTNGKGKLKRMLSFLSVDKRKVFRYEIVLRGIQPCFLHSGALGLF